MIFETQEELEACLAFWQRVLRLEHWEFVIRRSRLRSFPKPREAQITRWPKQRRALIELVDRVDWKVDDEYPWEVDEEINIVHELLHVIMDDWTPEDGSLEEFSMETAIEVLARALVGLERGKWKKERPEAKRASSPKHRPKRSAPPGKKGTGRA